MNNWVLSINYSKHITHFQFLSIKFYSDVAVRVRFAPSPTGRYFISYTEI